MAPELIGCKARVICPKARMVGEIGTIVRVLSDGMVELSFTPSDMFKFGYARDRVKILKKGS